MSRLILSFSLLLLALTTHSSLSFARSISLGFGAYQGSIYTNYAWKFKGSGHSLHAGIGWTPGLFERDIYQLNFKPSFRLIAPICRQTLCWSPLLLRPFATYSPDKSFTFFSPSRYPDRTYYPVTSLRYGLLFASHLNAQIGKTSSGAYYELGVVDYTLIALYNNKFYLPPHHLIGAGFGLQIDF